VSIALPRLLELPGTITKLHNRDCFRKSLRTGGVTPVVPRWTNRKKPVRHDQETYKGRQRHRTLRLLAQVSGALPRL